MCAVWAAARPYRAVGSRGKQNFRFVMQLESQQAARVPQTFGRQYHYFLTNLGGGHKTQPHTATQGERSCGVHGFWRQSSCSQDLVRILILLSSKAVAYPWPGITHPFPLPHFPTPASWRAQAAC